MCGRGLSVALAARRVVLSWDLQGPGAGEQWPSGHNPCLNQQLDGAVVSNDLALYIVGHVGVRSRTVCCCGEHQACVIHGDSVLVVQLGYQSSRMPLRVALVEKAESSLFEFLW